MTDPELIAKKLARIETCLQQLRTLARLEHIESDVREVVESRLQDLDRFVAALRARGAADG